MLSSLVCNPTASCSALDNPYKPAHGRHISIKENKRHWHLLSCQQRWLQRGRAVSTSGSTAGQAPSPAPARTLLRQASTCLCPTPRARGSLPWGEVVGFVWSQDRIKAGRTVWGAGTCGGYGFLLPEGFLEPPAGAVPLRPWIPSSLLPGGPWSSRRWGGIPSTRPLLAERHRTNPCSV